jgi:hypothetical protein
MKIFITILKVAAGWRFLYERVIKLITFNWTISYYKKLKT